MISTEQKTENWIKGALERMIQLGIFTGITINKDSFIDEDEWWELDSTRKEWVDSDLFKKTVNYVLSSYTAYEKNVIFQHLYVFFVEEMRYEFLRTAISHLYANV